MRTTITIDDDLAGRLRALQISRGGWKRTVNEVLRRGLDAEDVPSGRPYIAPVFDLGKVRRGVDLDRISTVLGDPELFDR